MVVTADPGAEFWALWLIIIGLTVLILAAVGGYIATEKGRNKTRA